MDSTASNTRTAEQVRRQNTDRARTNKLTAAKIAALKPRAKHYKVADGDGLYLNVMPSGSMIWRLRYRLPGERAERVMKIGEHGDRDNQVTLADARARRDAMKSHVTEKRDPKVMLKVEREKNFEECQNTFAACAAGWLESKRADPAQKKEGVSDHYHRQLRDALDRDVLPVIGDLPIRSIHVDQVEAILQSDRLKSLPSWRLYVFRVISETFCYAVRKRRADFDPCYAIRFDYIGKKNAPKKTPNPHLKTLDDIGALVTALDERDESDRLRVLGVKLAMLTLVRPGELMGAMWNEFDFAARLWHIPAERMKMKRPHTVPLSNQALALLDELRTISGDTPALFPLREVRIARKPGAPFPTMFPNTLSRFLRAMGWKTRVTGHGLRGTAATALGAFHGADGKRRFEKDWVNLALAHKPVGILEEHYDHNQYMPQRAMMLQFYADLILPQRGKVVPITSRALLSLDAAAPALPAPERDAA